MEKMRRGQLSRNTVSGKVTSLERDGENIKAVIGGEEYVINKTFAKSTAYRLKTGMEAVYYLDSNGRIAWCNDIKTAEGIGYIIKVSKADTDEETAYVKLLTSDGKINAVKRVYSETSGLCDTNALPEGYSAGTGYVYYKDYPYLTVTEYLPETGMFDEEKLKLYKGDSYGIFLETVSRKDKQFRAGNANELCDYETAGEDCTKVFTASLNNEVRIIFEIK